MIHIVVPDWLRIILSVFSFLSFLPQLRSIWHKRDSTGISLYYVLLNLISATEQFTLGFYLVFTNTSGGGTYNHKPNSIGDFLNLVQHTVVWMMFLVLFMACLRFSPSRPRSTKATVVAIYVAFILISVVPACFVLYVLATDPPEMSRWASDFFGGIHMFLVQKVATIGSILSLFAQRSRATALDITGLAFQATIFTLVAISWIFRVVFPPAPIGKWTWHFLVSWYEIVGWAAVDNGVFAFVQFVLYCTARRAQGRAMGERDSEDEPLLT